MQCVYASARERNKQHTLKKTKSKENQFADYDRATVTSIHARTGESFTAALDLSLTRDRLSRLEGVSVTRLSRTASADLKADIKKYRDWETTLLRLFPELKIKQQ